MRVVSLVPSLTELLADLGLDAEVVGLTRFCVRPPGWKARKRIVGGTKTVHVERVRALAPTLVLANKEENVREQVEALAAFAPVLLTDIATVDEALATIREIGDRVGRAEAATTLAQEIAAGFDALRPNEPPLRVAYLIWRGPWMAAGGGTFIHDVLARAGYANVFGGRPRYPVVTPEELAEARPDALFLSSEPFPFRAKHLAEARALVPDARVELVDGELFSWYGSRMRHTPPYLAALRASLKA